VADPQVAVEELVGVGAVDGVGVVANHCPLLETGAFRALERDPTTVPVAQVINLKEKENVDHVSMVKNQPDSSTEFFDNCSIVAMASVC